MKLSVVELFAGVGGFRVGLNHINSFDENGRAIENNNWNFVWANQYEPSSNKQHAFECYITRFGDKNHSNDDISKVDKKVIPDHNLLVGGFPCQDYSVARSLSNNKGIEGKKGVLFWEISDILETKKTPFVLLENVDRLLKSPSSNRGRDFAIMLKTLNDLGYDAQWRVLNAGDYSMPQKRKRVFIFAYRKDLKWSKSIKCNNLNLNELNIFNKVFPIETITELKHIDLNKYEDVLDISLNYKSGSFHECGIMIDNNIYHSKIKPINEVKHTLSSILEKASSFNDHYDNLIINEQNLEKWKFLKGSKKINRTSKEGHNYIYSEGAMSFPDNLDEPARTMLTSEGSINRTSHIIFDKKINNYRILTPLECELIQMFPANWTNTMPDKKRYFMMGNALVTGVISRMEPLLKEIIKNED
ncbi:DNA (cytosine-5-)-methyltransferase [Mycoplasma crocodyli]|uniref:Cytosine-specific methyltransferase n=1 Tax=Mycoplasma crocodyli (strain ATCC 51981 / MP145) TaxID=512564 RepID=D5E5B3_MYCCM|nr:DNA (cytosine-5-)-methyltransferase [Mycoplasma crocodyli]ADE19372.1 cytosine-specific DNA modification methyltransferase [Mycoplasma crocodyli MP145]